MINSLKDFIQLAFDNSLNRENTSQAFNIIMSGESTDAQIGAFLIALQTSLFLSKAIPTPNIVNGIFFLVNKSCILQKPLLDPYS